MCLHPCEKRCEWKWGGVGGGFGAVKELCHNDLMGPKGGKR